MAKPAVAQEAGTSAPHLVQGASDDGPGLLLRELLAKVGQLGGHIHSGKLHRVLHDWRLGVGRPRAPEPVHQVAFCRDQLLA